MLYDNFDGRIRPLRFWVQKVLPLVYDDSLSYYELLAKVVDKINELADAENKIIDKFDRELAATVKEVLQEWLDNGTIAEYLNNLVIVEDYGAKGDGVTDDTDAINTAFKNNPNKTIFFKGGTYLISKPLVIYGRWGAQCINFDGAHIVVDPNVGAPIECVIKMEDDPDNGLTYGTPRINGGYIECNGKALKGIICKAYNTIFSKLYLANPYETGVEIDVYDGAISNSTNIRFESCSILCRGAFGGAEIARDGMVIKVADTFIRDTNIFRFRRGIVYTTTPHTIEGCHIYGGMINKPAYTPNYHTCAFFFDINVFARSGFEIMNCYIDNYEYAVSGNVTSNSHYPQIIFNGGIYLWSDYYGYDRVYLVDPAVNFNVSFYHTMLKSNATPTIIDPYFRADNVINRTNYVADVIDFNFGYARGATADYPDPLLWQAPNLVPNGKSRYLGEMNFTANKFYHIGSVICNSYNTLAAPIDIKFNNRGYSGVKFTLRYYDANDGGFISNVEYLSRTGAVPYLIATRKQPIVHEMDGATFYEFPLYLGYREPTESTLIGSITGFTSYGARLYVRPAAHIESVEILSLDDYITTET